MLKQVLYTVDVHKREKVHMVSTNFTSARTISKTLIYDIQYQTTDLLYTDKQS